MAPTPSMRAEDAKMAPVPLVVCEGAAAPLGEGALESVTSIDPSPAAPVMAQTLRVSV